MFTKCYNNAQEAFEDLYLIINKEGYYTAGTKALHNVGIQILNPLDNEIKTSWRKWKKTYADYEWNWYLSKSPNAEEISKKASIWLSLMDDNGNVNSNYGYQWSRANQLTRVIEMLKLMPTTRKASISIYDGKEMDNYSLDTPCTYAINFYIDSNNKLSMQVMMRSNDLVFGFCNDQYCFSKLQEYVANELKLEIGIYFHFACNMHIYERHYNMGL